MQNSTIFMVGLMRCCIQTIKEDEGPDEVGRTLCCKFHEVHEDQMPQMVYTAGFKIKGETLPSGWRLNHLANLIISMAD